MLCNSTFEHNITTGSFSIEQAKHFVIIKLI